MQKNASLEGIIESYTQIISKLKENEEKQEKSNLKKFESVEKVRADGFCGQGRFNLAF